MDAVVDSPSKETSRQSSVPFPIKQETETTQEDPTPKQEEKKSIVVQPNGGAPSRSTREITTSQYINRLLNKHNLWKRKPSKKVSVPPKPKVVQVQPFRKATATAASRKREMNEMIQHERESRIATQEQIDSDRTIAEQLQETYMNEDSGIISLDPNFNSDDDMSTHNWEDSGVGAGIEDDVEVVLPDLPTDTNDEENEDSFHEISDEDEDENTPNDDFVNNNPDEDDNTANEDLGNNNPDEDDEMFDEDMMTVTPVGNRDESEINNDHNYSLSGSDQQDTSNYGTLTFPTSTVMPLSIDFMDTLGQLYEDKKSGLFTSFAETKLFDGSGKPITTESIFKEDKDTIPTETLNKENAVYMDVIQPASQSTRDDNISIAIKRKAEDQGKPTSSMTNPEKGETTLKSAVQKNIYTLSTTDKITTENTKTVKSIQIDCPLPIDNNMSSGKKRKAEDQLTQTTTMKLADKEDKSLKLLGKTDVIHEKAADSNPKEDNDDITVILTKKGVPFSVIQSSKSGQAKLQDNSIRKTLGIQHADNMMKKNTGDALDEPSKITQVKKNTVTLNQPNPTGKLQMLPLEANKFPNEWMKKQEVLLKGFGNKFMLFKKQFTDASNIPKKVQPNIPSVTTEKKEETKTQLSFILPQVQQNNPSMSTEKKEETKNQLSFILPQATTNTTHRMTTEKKEETKNQLSFILPQVQQNNPSMTTEKKEETKTQLSFILPQVQQNSNNMGDKKTDGQQNEAYIQNQKITIPVVIRDNKAVLHAFQPIREDNKPQSTKILNMISNTKDTSTADTTKAKDDKENIEDIKRQLKELQEENKKLSQQFLHRGEASEAAKNQDKDMTEEDTDGHENPNDEFEDDQSDYTEEYDDYEQDVSVGKIQNTKNFVLFILISCHKFTHSRVKIMAIRQACSLGRGMGPEARVAM